MSEIIDRKMIRKWKTVDTLTIRKIAHKSTSGVIFSTCSKSDIIESIENIAVIQKM